ncbi:MAG: XdhC/CoxI family protein [Rhodobacterales bacterium]|nr:MAG: XdhC/CoxI family protein [Rhodobacterales bacterium]
MRDQIPERALDWHRAGRGAVLATVVETWGSAPRRTGSQLVVAGDGAMEGSVSGGCVEGAVVAEAAEALRAGAARMLEFGVSDDDAFAVGLACGGRIRVLLEPVGTALPEALLAELVAARAARRPVAYVVPEGGAPRLEGPGAYPDRFRLDRSGVEEDGTFVALHTPPLRLFVVGAVHIAQHLLPMARGLGHDVTLVDPRGAFGSAERFPGEEISDDWPDEALLGRLDGRCAVVTLTHDPKLDDPALIVALPSEALYVGALGSTRTHAKRVARLEAAGLSAQDIARLHAPVGLDIGAAGPAEIALSILAQITQVLRQG